MMKPKTALAIVVCLYAASFVVYYFWRLGYVSGYITGRVENDLLDLKDASKVQTSDIINRAKGD